MQPFRLCQLISIVLSLALHVDWVTIVSVYSDPTFSPKRRRAPSEAMRKRPAAATDTKEQSEEGNREARPADQQQADECIQATEGEGPKVANPFWQWAHLRMAALTIWWCVSDEPRGRVLQKKY